MNNRQFSIDDMDGHDFEYFCADILKRNGFSNVEVTRGSGDYGIDILAEKDGISYAIQCKRYNGNVGNKAVQEALSGKVYYDCDEAVVLTNSYFTNQAMETARRTDVTLWDRDMLFAMVKTAYPNNAAFPSKRYLQSAAEKQNNPGCASVVAGFIAIILVFAFLTNLIRPESPAKREDDEKTQSENLQQTLESSDIKEDTQPTLESANVRQVEIDHILYQIQGGTASVVGLTDEGKEEKFIIIPKQIEDVPVTDIASEAFYRCEKLEGIELPDTIESIGTRAFYWCKSLNEIHVPSKVTIIEDSAFSACKSLSSVSLPDGLTDIGYDAFWACNFSTIELPKTLKTIGFRAFCECENLKTIEIPEGVTSMGGEVFKFDKSLSSISLPNTLTEIGKACFWGCKALKTITIPPEVKELNYSMFANCERIQTIYIPESCKIPKGDYPFASCNLKVQIIRY